MAEQQSERSHPPPPILAREILEARGNLRLVPDLTLGLLHRLNNVMTGISFTLEACEAELASNGAAAELLGTLGDSIRDAQAVMRRATEVNLSLGSPEMEYLDLNAFLRTDRDLCRMMLPKGAEFVLETVTEALVVRGSQRGLRRIFLPILANAGDAAGDDCRVGVRSLPGNQIDLHRYTPVPDNVPAVCQAVVITDNGHGVPPALLDRIFEPFVTSQEGRLGLGLFGAATAALEFGGFVAVRTRMERGAEFLVMLPGVEE